MTPTAARAIYPELPDPLTPGDLQQLFNPSFDERQWAPTVARTIASQVALLVQLKIFQTIGRFRRAADIPPAAIEYVAHRMGGESGSTLIFPDRTLYRHRPAVLKRLEVVSWGAEARALAQATMQKNAQHERTQRTSSIRRLTHSFVMGSNCRLSLRYVGWLVPRTAKSTEPNGTKCVAASVRRNKLYWKHCWSWTPQNKKKLGKAMKELRGYIGSNEAFIPNYGERYRHDETISTAFVESTVNQVISKRFVKKQQMRWKQRGAHLLLQTRVQVLNDDLRGTFCRWFPGMKADQQVELKAA